MRHPTRPLTSRAILGVVAVALLLSVIGGLARHAITPGVPATSPEPGTFAPRATSGRVHVGTAVAGGRTNDALQDPAYRAILQRDFHQLTPENQMKWSIIHPAPQTYDFGGADGVAAFASANGQSLRGHTLLWSGSLPDWVRRPENRSCEAYRTMLHDHIRTVVSRYASVVSEWDVANEVVDDNGRLRSDSNPFLAACGESIIRDAFVWTHQYDPDATLYLNDFGIDVEGPKLAALEHLVERLRRAGAPIQGVGFQSHLTTRSDLSQLPGIFRRFAQHGLRVAITEADVKIRITASIPQPGEMQKQAQVFAELARACHDEPACRSFTFWGFSDRFSWAGDPAFGEGAAAPLDSDLRPKPAYDALSRALAG